MATVVQPVHLKQVSRMNAEKLFGVPAQAFGDINGALAWLDKVAAPSSAWSRKAAGDRLRSILDENQSNPPER